MSVGTIERLKSGRYAVRLPRSVDTRRKRIGTYATYAEAESIVNGTLALARNHHITIPGGHTFGSFLNEFLDRRELADISNVDRERRIANKHLQAAPFAGSPISVIQRVEILDWWGRLQRTPTERTGEPLQANSVRGIKSVISLCFEDAMNRGLITSNPAANLKLSRATLARTKEDKKCLVPKEQDAFLESIPSDGSAADDRRYYAFMMGTALRPSEQRSIRWGDVHLNAEVPFVIIRFGTPRRGPTKTGKPRRVYLVGIALEAAQAQMASLPGKLHPDRIFWPNAKGKPRSARLPDQFRSWLDRAGAKDAIGSYVLRHTAATSLQAGWWSKLRWTPQQASGLLGHSTTRMTERYTHLGETEVEAITRETNAIYSGPRLVQNPTQALEITQDDAAFVNRRSRVQVSELAPRDH